MRDTHGILGDHDRDIANTARLGTVSEVMGDRARVTIGELVTDMIPWVSRRAAHDYDWWQPSVGEQVVVLALWGDVSQGVIIGSVAQDNFAPPADGTIWAKRFRDGTTLSYDPASHALAVNAGTSPVTIICDSVNLTAQSVNLNVPNVTCTGTIRADVDVVAGGISLKGHTHGGVQSGGSKTGKPE